MEDLDIVNACITSQGQKPLGSISDKHPLMAAIRAEIAAQKRNLLSRGWWFNREPVTLTPDTANKIILPGDCLVVRAQDRTRKLAKRGQLLYDLTNGTDLFDTSVDVIIIRDLPLSYLEEVVASYIRALVTAWFVNTYDGTTKVDPEPYRIALNAEEVRNQPVNWLESNPRIAYQRWIRGALRSNIYLPR